MSMKSELIVDKFDGSNFHIWKYKMMVYLKGKELWEVVEKSIDDLATGKTTDEKDKSISNLKNKDNRAFMAITMSLSDGQIILLQSKAIETAKNAWELLLETFEKKSLMNKLYLKRKLMTTTMREGDDIELHLNCLISIATQLECIGSKIDEEDLVITILSSLPDTYKTICTTLEAKGSVSLEDLKSILMNDDLKRKEKQNLPNDQALSTKYKKFNKKSTKRVAFKCYNCGKVGHAAKDCWSKKASANDKSVFMANSNSTNEDDIWYLDSGASSHMCKDNKYMQNYRKFNESLKIHIAEASRAVDAVGIGDFNGKIMSRKGELDVQMKDVYHVPNLSKNLMSVSKLTQKGNSVNFCLNEFQIINSNGVLIAAGRSTDQIYKLKIKLEKLTSNSATNKKHSKMIWHRRLGHFGGKFLNEYLKEHRIIINQNEKLNFCNSCAHGKQHRFPFKKSKSISKSILDLVHSDLCGPMSTQSFSGERYLLTFIDDYSRYSTIYLLVNKDEVLKYFKIYSNYMKNQFDKSIKILRTYNGGEYKSNEFKIFCENHGIKHEFTVPYSPQQNGKAERLNRTLIETSRCLLHDANLEKRFWAEAVSTANYLRNRRPSQPLDNKTPYEIFHKQKPHIDHLRCFRSKAYSLNEHRSKLDSKSIECILVGYDTSSKGYRLFNLKTKKIIIARNVLFNETSNNQQIFDFDFNNDTSEDVESIKAIGFSNNEGDYKIDVESKSNGELQHQMNTDGYEVDFSPNEDITKDQQVLRRSERIKNLGNTQQANMTFIEPKNWKQALLSSDSDKWIEAAKAEIDSLKKNKTWVVVKKPLEKSIIGSRWVFKLKYDGNNNSYKHKARLVAQGYTQQEGPDYSETFSPVAKHTSIRLLLSLSTCLNYEVRYLDIETAFLYGNLNGELYIKQPEGFEDYNFPDYVCKLKKSIYGLKQSPRCWYNLLEEYLSLIGFERCKTDNCIFINKETEKTYIAIYVDDIIIIGNSSSNINNIILKMKERFRLRDLGELQFCLGFKFKRKRNECSSMLSQEKYTLDTIDEFKMNDCKSCKTPSVSGFKLVKCENSLLNFPYRQLIGKLIYLSILTRPDISYAVNVSSRFLDSYDESHWLFAKRILRYLKGSSEMGICYSSCDEPNVIHGYCDSNFALDEDDRRSTTGYIFIMNNGVISWRSVKQNTVALSSTEAEYMALSNAAQEALFLRHLCEELGIEQKNPTIIHCDNQSAIKLANNPQSISRTRHIDIKYHFIREKVNEGSIKIEYCPTELMKADMLTKSLGQTLFMKHRNALGIVNVVD